MEDIVTTTTVEDLPEDVVLFHILSALPTLDAISFSILVRSWHNLWHEVPGLCFDIIPFYKKSSPPFSHARDSFADFVGKTFSQLPVNRPLQYFQLAFHHADYGRRETEVRSWILSAVERGVLKLEIHFYQNLLSEGRFQRWSSFERRLRPVDVERTFEFRFFDIMNSSVKEVQLHYCGIILPSNVSAAAGFESLKKLVLRKVQLIKTHEIGCLLSVCVNLEILHLEIIHNLWVNKFDIHLKRLKKLTLKILHPLHKLGGALLLDIDTPKLLSLTVGEVGFGLSSMRINVPSLVEADFDLFMAYFEKSKVWHGLLMSFQNVKRLRLQTMSRFPWNGLATFNYLKNLELVTGFSEDDLLGILGILNASPMLESVIIDSPDYYFEWLEFDDGLTLSEKLDNKFVDLKIPRLQEITIKNFRKTENELYLVDWIKTNNVILERIVAVPPEDTREPPILLWEAKQPTSAL